MSAGRILPHLITRAAAINTGYRSAGRMEGVTAEQEHALALGYLYGCATLVVSLAREAADLSGLAVPGPDDEFEAIEFVALEIERRVVALGGRPVIA